MPKLPKSLRGRLLIAQPELTDPHFAQSIVFLAHHDDEGAIGFILNRPTGSTLVECVSQSNAIKACFSGVPVLRGGPVGGARIAVVVFQQPPRRKTPVAHLGLSLEKLEPHLTRRNTWVRAFMGYSGWDGGQLEREIHEGSWLLRPADTTIFNLRIAAGLWPFLVSGDDRWRAMIDYLPEESERN